jgi:hypothetical protein
MLVGLLTITQKDSLLDELVQVDWYFNPVQDGLGQWVISTEEINGSVYQVHEWVKSIPLIEYIPIVPPSGDTENHFSQFFSGQTS